MKSFLLIPGIVLITIGVASLLFSLLQGYGYYHLLDGDAQLYSRLHGRMIVFLVVGILLVVSGALCIIFRK